MQSRSLSAEICCLPPSAFQSTQRKFHLILFQDPVTQNDSVQAVLSHGEELSITVQFRGRDIVKVCESVHVCVFSRLQCVTHSNEAKVLMKWGIKKEGMFAIS